MTPGEIDISYVNGLKGSGTVIKATYWPVSVLHGCRGFHVVLVPAHQTRPGKAESRDQSCLLDCQLTDLSLSLSLSLSVLVTNVFCLVCVVHM